MDKNPGLKNNIQTIREVIIKCTGVYPNRKFGNRIDYNIADLKYILLASIDVECKVPKYFQRQLVEFKFYTYKKGERIASAWTVK